MTEELAFNKRNHIAAIQLLAEVEKLYSNLSKTDVLRIIDEMKRITESANYL